MDKVTFTSVVKDELCNLSDTSLARQKALVAAYLRCNSYLNIKNNKTSLVFNTENAKVARFIYQLVKTIYSPKIHFTYIKNKKLNKTTSYTTIIESKIDEIFADLDLSFFENKISRNIVYNDETIGGYLAGVFLACGSVNSPYNSNYHLELTFSDEEFAKRVVKLFLRYKGTIFEPKMISRRNQFVVYIKRSDKITDFLVAIGADKSCMEYEDARASRDFLNSANRLSNFDTANMTKTVGVAQKQIKWIKVIDKYLGIKNIPNEKLKLLCQLRLAKESDSLADLAEQMSEKLDKTVSKSNVAHLFKKIEEMAEKYSHGTND